MPCSEAYEALKAGKSEWNDFRMKAFKGGNGAALTDGRIDLRSADLSYMDLSHYDLSRVDFSTVDEGFPAVLSGAKLSNAYLFGSRFSRTRFTGADLSGANVTGAEFDSVTFDENSNLRSIKGNEDTAFRGCSLSGVDFSGADLKGCDLRGSALRDADLSGASFVKARLGGTTWQGARIDEATNFDLAHFSDHPVSLDQSDTMVVPAGVNWQKIRWVGSLRLLPFSILGLIACFILMPAVRLAQVEPLSALAFTGFTPALVHALMIGFAFLFVGAVLYSTKCPEEVQEFSAAQWVHLAKNPRPIYLAKSLQMRSYALASFVLVLTGGVILAFAFKIIVLGMVCPVCF
ncbi:MAG: pentapeptide repeat-containing protein [Alphaproteobacteria bacterium]|nr:pentapeptide repeat-containing protein [Alphaproteobacteria bacterium]MCB1839144.1 pentapeptide repeat-containing protein [Alphaproteobacteria bacterium]